LGCTNCHNPHGNAWYRILRPVPLGGYNKEIDPPYDDKVVQVSPESPKKYTWEYEADSYHRDSSYTPEELGDWCAQCHTRYMAGSGAGSTDSGDAIFAYRHNTSGTYLSCPRCHVAHGTTATMGVYSGDVLWPNSAPSPSGDARSSLLHSNSRGVCARCHVSSEGEVSGHSGGTGNCGECHAGPPNSWFHSGAPPHGAHPWDPVLIGAGIECTDCHYNMHHGDPLDIDYAVCSTCHW